MCDIPGVWGRAAPRRRRNGESRRFYSDRGRAANRRISARLIPLAFASRQDKDCPWVARGCLVHYARPPCTGMGRPMDSIALRRFAHRIAVAESGSMPIARTLDEEGRAIPPVCCAAGARCSGGRRKRECYPFVLLSIVLASPQASACPNRLRPRAASRHSAGRSLRGSILFTHALRTADQSRMALERTCLAGAVLFLDPG